TSTVSIKGVASCAICAAFLIMLSVICAAAPADVMVRGRLDRLDSRGALYPANSVVLTLNNPQRGRSARVYTGNDGMYYFHNVPEGRYTWEIWIGAKPMLRDVEVHGPHTDVPPILIR